MPSCTEDERERLLPDCRVGEKESESENYSSWMHFWTMVSLTIAWQGRLEWQTALDVCWFQVRAWRHRSYIAEIPLLAHGLTVKLSPCQCSHSSPAGRIAAPLCEHPKSQSATGSLRLAPGWFSIFLVESVHSPHLLFFTDKPHACKLQSHNWLEVLWWVLYTQF